MRSSSPRVEQPVDSVITTDVSVNCAHPLVGVAKLCSGQTFVYERVYMWIISTKYRQQYHK